MKKIIYPDKAEWADMLRRPALHTETLRDTVKEVLDRVKSEGDRAVIEYEERFDKVKLDALAVTEAEMAEAEKDVPIELKAAIMLAQKNIHAFHAAQRFERKESTDCSGSDLLAESGCHRESRFVHSRRHGSVVLYRADVGYSCTNSRLQRNSSLHSSR